jgi:hypothetical protein
MVIEKFKRTSAVQGLYGSKYILTHFMAQITYVHIDPYCELLLNRLTCYYVLLLNAFTLSCQLLLKGSVDVNPAPGAAMVASPTPVRLSG